MAGLVVLDASAQLCDRRALLGPRLLAPLTLERLLGAMERTEQALPVLLELEQYTRRPYRVVELAHGCRDLRLDAVELHGELGSARRRRALATLLDLGVTASEAADLAVDRDVGDHRLASGVGQPARRVGLERGAGSMEPRLAGERHQPPHQRRPRRQRAVQNAVRRLDPARDRHLALTVEQRHPRRLPVVEVDGVELVFPGLLSDVGLGCFHQDVPEAVDLEAVPGQGPGAVMVHSG